MIPVAIPAYCPGRELASLVDELLSLAFDNIVVVDDGSPGEFRGLFESIGALQGVRLVTHGRNMGKGAALKTAFRSALECFPDKPGIATADADGQHSPTDILKVAGLFESKPDCLVLGSREFASSAAPSRSRMGNIAARAALRLLTGARVSDTQTGLRAVPAVLMRQCIVSSCERYDFEMDMLLTAIANGVPVVETPIRAIYSDGAHRIRSHFRPVSDSWRVVWRLLGGGFKRR